jgi:NADH dehydrogenase
MVLGGTGFVGRNAVAALLARGHEVIVGTRHPQRAALKLPPGAQACQLRKVRFEDLTAHYVWKPLLADVDAVVNAAGILRERGSETYDRVHAMAPAALALACERLGLRLIHVSALGLRRKARSAFIRSKAEGERAIAATGADYSIVRPSLLEGEGGFGADWLRKIAGWPVHFIPTTARGRLAALDVRDLAEAIAVLCEARNKPEWREVELGGTVKRTLPEHLAALRTLRDERPALRFRVPQQLALAAGTLCDLLHLTPYGVGPLELLWRDNLPRENLLMALLGRAPLPVGRELPAARPAYASGLTVVGRIRFAAREFLQ